MCGGWVIEKRVRRELLEEVDSRQLKVEEKELTRSSPRRVEQAACPCSTESLPLAMLHGIDVSGTKILRLGVLAQDIPCRRKKTKYEDSA